jgi:hypothetical protein
MLAPMLPAGFIFPRPCWSGKRSRSSSKAVVDKEIVAAYMSRQKTMMKNQMNHIFYNHVIARGGLF